MHYEGLAGDKESRLHRFLLHKGVPKIAVRSRKKNYRFFLPVTMVAVFT